MIAWILGWAVACGPQPSAILAGLGSENPVIREDMALLARRAESEDVVQALVGLLEDPVEEVRVRAVESLGILGDPGAVEALVACLAGSEGRVQRATIDALGQIRDERAVEPLVAHVSQADTVPLNAVWALGELGDIRAMALLAGLRDHPDLLVSWNAEQALEKLPAAPAKG
jgi:HEAT repeat protein